MSNLFYNWLSCCTPRQCCISFIVLVVASQPSLSCGHCVLTHCCVLLQSLYAMLFCWMWILFLESCSLRLSLFHQWNSIWLECRGACALYVHRPLADRVNHKSIFSPSWHCTLRSSQVYLCTCAAVALEGACVAASLELFHWWHGMSLL